MNSDLLIEHFERIADSPDAIPRLRRFILDLAVRGKLVEQDSRDQPASELLSELREQKARLIREEKIRNPKVLGEFIEESVPFPIPVSWAWCHLAEVGVIVGGGTPPSAESDNFAPSGTAIAWLTPADLGKHTSLYISHGARDLSAKGLSSASATVMPRGSVLFTSRAPIGYTAIALNEVSTNQGFKSVVPFIPSCNHYIAVYFRAFGKWIDDKASGTTFREVSGKIVARLPFPLPPLSEQHRIVAKVDELMEFCDALEAAQRRQDTQREHLTLACYRSISCDPSPETLRQTHFFLDHLLDLTTRPEQIKQLRQTILQLAIRGQLVAQNSKDESARELLKRIRTEREVLLRKGEIKKEKISKLSANGGRAFEIPPSWEWVSLGDVAFSFKYGTSVKCSYEAEGEPVLRIPNIRGGQIDLQDMKYGPLSEREVNDLSLRLGDLLMVRSNGSLDLVGRAAIVDAAAVGYCYAGYLVRVRTDVELLDTRYLLFALTTRHVRDQIEIPIRSAVGLKNVNTSELSSLTFPIAPLAEQHRIVARLDELMTICDSLESQINEVQAMASSLLESVLFDSLNNTESGDQSSAPPKTGGKVTSLPSIKCSVGETFR